MNKVKNTKKITVDEQIQDICHFVKLGDSVSLEKARILNSCLKLTLKSKGY